MHVVGGHTSQTFLCGQFEQRVVACRIKRVAVIPQLDKNPVTSEGLDEALEFASRCSHPIGGQRCRNCPFPAAGEHPGVSAQGVGEVTERELGRALLASKVPDTQRSREPAVSVDAIGKHE